MVQDEEEDLPAMRHSNSSPTGECRKLKKKKKARDDGQ